VADSIVGGFKADVYRGLNERIARIIDQDAFKSIDDGRDKIPGSLWGVRRTIALERAKLVVEELELTLGWIERNY
jgi:hypothetical protein